MNKELDIVGPLDGQLVTRTLADQTVEEVVYTLTEYANAVGEEDFGEGDTAVYEWWADELYGDTIKVVPGFASVSIVENFGGEGQGDEYYLVLKLADGGTTRYLRVDGYYQSYDGGYYDGHPYFVKPVERTVTFYE